MPLREETVCAHACLTGDWYRTNHVRMWDFAYQGLLSQNFYTGSAGNVRLVRDVNC